jgi:hypothetical protein
MRSGANAPASESGQAGCRSVSKAGRDGSAPAAMANPASATTRNATRQPSASASPGSIAPASAAPAGTPVCLIENVSAIRDGGAVRTSTCDDAGVIGP